MKNLLRRMVASAGVVLAIATLGGVAVAGPNKKGDKIEKGTPTSTDATFERFLITPHGTIRGLLLTNGAAVRARADAVKDTTLKSGDVLHIDGRLKTSAAGKIYFKSVVKKNGVIVADATGGHGKGDKDAQKTKLNDVTATSTVSTLLAGPMGNIEGVVLADGTMAYAPHHGDLTSLKLKKGDAVTVTGPGGNYKLGRALTIKTVKLPTGDTKTL